MIDNQHQPIDMLLSMDTSTAALTIALLDGDKVLKEHHEQAERNHSIRLVPAIQEMVASLGLTMKDVKAIAAGQGPGSYTGVRIGVTVAKTLAWTLDIPLLGVSSLEALAYGAVDLHAVTERKKQWLIPLMDARRGRVYTGLYEKNAHQWKCHSTDRIVLRKQWVEHVLQTASEIDEQTRPAGLTFVGDIDDQLEEELSAHKEHWVGKIQMLKQLPQAADIGRLAEQQRSAGRHEDVHSFIPNYTQLSEAETNLMAKKK